MDGDTDSGAAGCNVRPTIAGLMRRVLAVLLPLALVFAIAVWRMQGPEPQAATAAGFSAARALDVLRALLAEGVPHPIGTPANARVRDRSVARLRAKCLVQ